MKNKLYTKSSTIRSNRWMLFTICFVLSLFKVSESSAQLTGVKTVPGSYATLAAAIADLNAQGVGAGGVTINLTVAETAPAGGYLIGGPGSPLLTTSSAANPVIIDGGTNIVTAFTPQASGSFGDAIIKLSGADYVTIKNFVLVENAANATVAGATNNMTEFGIALFPASAVDGAQNNTIKNNDISLKRTYQNSFGVYSNTNERIDSVAPATDQLLTASSGANSFNKVYSNGIHNVAYGAFFIGSRALTAVNAMDNGNDVGGSSLGTTNNFTDWGYSGTLVPAGFRDMTGQFICVYHSNQINNNASFNTFVSANFTPRSGAIACEAIRFAWPDGATIQPTGVFTSKADNNNITITITPQAGHTGAIDGITFSALLATPGATLSASNNTVLNCAISGANASTNAFRGLSNSAQPGTMNWDNNTFKGTTTNTTGGQTQMISNQGTVQTTFTCRNNKLGLAGSGNHLIRYLRASTATNFYLLDVGGTPTSTHTITGNDFTNIVQDLPSSGSRLFIALQPALPNEIGNHDISNNTFTNINMTANATGSGGGSLQFIEDFPGGAGRPNGSIVTIDNNKIVGTYVSGGTIPFILFLNTGGTSNNTVNEKYRNNDFSNLTFASPTNMLGFADEDGDVVGPIKEATGNVFKNIHGAGTSSIGSILEISFGSTPSVVSGNVFDDISSGGNTIILLSQGGQETITQNTISAVTALGTDVRAIDVILNDDNSVVSKNKICNISVSNVAGKVHGIYAGSNGIMEISNNIVGDLRASVSSAAYSVVGIDVTNATPANIYYNTVSIGGTSSGTTWGSACVSTADTTYELRNNILINSGTAKGTGLCAALHAANAVHVAPSNLTAASDRNDYFAGTIYDDGTNTFGSLGSYQAFVAPREANSVSQSPSFISTTCGNVNFLHLTAGQVTAVESSGSNIAGITDDIDGNIRQGNAGYAGTGTAPDMGADEFAGIAQPPCTGSPTTGSITGSSEVCNGTGTTLSLTGASTDQGVVYQWKKNGVDVAGATGTLLATGPLSVGASYQVRVTCNLSGQKDSTAVFAVSVNPNPTVTVGASPSLLCLPTVTPATLTANSVGGTGASTYAWSPSRGLTPSTAVGNPISALPDFTTTYQVIGTDSKGCVGISTATVNVSNTPTAVTATATPSSVCAGNTSQLLVTQTASVPLVVPTYSFAASSGVYTTISGAGGTDLPGLRNDDVVVNAIPIGFNFQYEGVSHSTFSVNSNGWLSFDVTLNAGAGQTNNLNTPGIPVVAPLWDDISGISNAADATTGRASYLLSGGPGTHVLTVEWSKWYWDFSNVDSVISFQVKLRELDNSIQFVYDPVPGVSPTFGSASVGLAGATSGNFLSLSDLSAGAVASTLNETKTISDKPVSGQTYTFTPPTPIISYAWNPGAGLSPSATVANPVATPVGNTTYTVTVTNTGCSASATVSVSSGSTLTASAATVSSSPVCQGTTITVTSHFTGGGAPFSYAWSDGQGGVYPNAPSVSANLAPGTYQFDCVITDPCGGNSTSSISVTVNPTPSASISPAGSVNACTADGALTLTASTDFGTSYLWKKNGTSTGITTSTFSASTSGSYTVVISNGTCSQESAATVVTVVANATPPIALSPSNINGCLNANTSANFTGHCIATTVVLAQPDSAFRATTTITQGHGPFAFLDWTGNQGFINPSAIRVPVSTFPAGSTITNVSVTLGLAHNKGGEMLLQISAPGQPLQNLFFDAAIQASVFGSSGGTSSLRYTFADGGAAIPGTGQIPNNVVYAPFAPFSNFNGLNPNGNWFVQVTDVQQVNGGRLDSVSITITATSPTGGVIWYNVPVGGSILATTASFNPITDGGASTATPGVRDFYAECSNGGCSSARTHVTFTVGGSADDGDPCTVDACDPATGNITHTPGGCGVDLYSNIFLEAYYLGGGVMNNPLFTDGLSSNPTHSDLVTVAVYGSVSHTLIGSATDTLHTNGNIHWKLPNAVTPGSSYWLKFTQRNHVATWSANPVLLSSTVTYSMSSAANKAFGDNEVGTHDTPGQPGDNFAFAFYAGDIWDGGTPDSGLQDGSVDATDFLDLDPHIQNGDGGYIQSDIDGNGSVDATDFLWLDPNVQNGIGSAGPF